MQKYIIAFAAMLMFGSAAGLLLNDYPGNEAFVFTALIIGALGFVGWLSK